MISLLLPTRQRPYNLDRFLQSVYDTADKPKNIEVIVMIDEDDLSYDKAIAKWASNLVRFNFIPRENLSVIYNKAFEKAVGLIYMLADDDVVFRTKGWDSKVLKVFKLYPDRIVLVHGDDGDPNQNKQIGTQPFIHFNWVKATGRFLPPYFTGDFTDTWLSDLANGVDRRIKIDIYTEHLHPAFNKAPDDSTYNEKWKKHFALDMPKVYADTLPERQEDINKLKQFINEFK